MASKVCFGGQVYSFFLAAFFKGHKMKKKLRVLAKDEFLDSGTWDMALSDSGLTKDHYYYAKKYPDLKLIGSNYHEYVKLMELEMTPLIRFLEGHE